MVERTEQLAPAGAGIIMNPNAMAVLERNGLAADVRAAGWPYRGRDTYTQRGRRLATRDYRPLYESGRLAVGTLVHRAHLQRVLYDSLPAGTVRFGEHVVKVQATADGVSVVTAAGKTLDADVLVAADGIRSTIRAVCFGGGEPVYLGYRSHRFVVDNVDRLAHFSEFLGRGQRVGLVPISRERLYVWTTFDSPHEATDWALGTPTAFRQRFAQFTAPFVRRALEQVTDMSAVLCTDIEEVHAPGWVRGRVVLLGDAAHALSPNMGQGAGMAMEDAAVLGEELDTTAHGDRALTEALASWQRRRRPRVETIARLSREIGEDGQRRGRLACWLRSRRIRRQGHDVASRERELATLLAWPLDGARA